MLVVEGLTPLGLPPLTFTVPRGECLGIAGPSGIGKSLTLRAVADLDPCPGRVLLDGTDRATLTAPTWRRRVLYVPAAPGFWCERTGDHWQQTDRSKALLERMFLPPDLPERPVAHLSTGEKQRVGLLRALLLEPEILLVDEPTSGLDSGAADAVIALLREHLEGGGAALWVAHDRSLLRALARRCLILDRSAPREEAA